MSRSEMRALIDRAKRSIGKLDWSGALEEIERTHPSAELHVMKGKILRDRGDYDSALEVYRRPIAVDPHSADAHCQCGILEERAGRHEQARRAFENAARLDPLRGMHWLCLGKSCSNVGDLQLAATHFNRAAEVFEADSSDNRMYNLACLASIRGDINRAHACFKEFLLRHPCALVWAEKDDDVANLRADRRFALLRSECRTPDTTR